MGIAVNLIGCLAGLLKWEGLAQSRMDHALLDEPVGLIRLLVVSEVRANDALQVHPEVAVVVLVHVAGGRGTGGDGAALLRDVDTGSKRFAARVLVDDVDVLAARELTDLLAEALPFLRILGVLVLPELVALCVAVDDVLRTHGAADVGLLGGGHHTHRDRARH